MASGTFSQERYPVKYYEDYTFPTSNAGISGNNNKYTVPATGIAYIFVEFSDITYSQITIHLNDYNIISNSQITTGNHNLNGYIAILPVFVNSGDVIKVTYYSTFTVKNCKLRLFV